MRLGYLILRSGRDVWAGKKRKYLRVLQFTEVAMLHLPYMTIPHIYPRILSSHGLFYVLSSVTEVFSLQKADRHVDSKSCTLPYDHSENVC